MVKVVIFVVLLTVVFSALLLLPTIKIDKGQIVESSAFAYVRAAMYFIPVSTAGSILGIVLVLWVFRVIVAVVKTIWSLLPVA